MPEEGLKPQTTQRNPTPAPPPFGLPLDLTGVRGPATGDGWTVVGYDAGRQMVSLAKADGEGTPKPVLVPLADISSAMRLRQNIKRVNTFRENIEANKKLLGYARNQARFGFAGGDARVIGIDSHKDRFLVSGTIGGRPFQKWISKNTLKQFSQEGKPGKMFLDEIGFSGFPPPKSETAQKIRKEKPEKTSGSPESARAGTLAEDQNQTGTNPESVPESAQETENEKESEDRNKREEEYEEELEEKTEVESSAPNPESPISSATGSPPSSAVPFAGLAVAPKISTEFQEPTIDQKEAHITVASQLESLRQRERQEQTRTQTSSDFSALENQPLAANANLGGISDLRKQLRAEKQLQSSLLPNALPGGATAIAVSLSPDIQSLAPFFTKANTVLVNIQNNLRSLGRNFQEARHHLNAINQRIVSLRQMPDSPERTAQISTLTHEADTAETQSQTVLTQIQSSRDHAHQLLLQLDGIFADPKSPEKKTDLEKTISELEKSLPKTEIPSAGSADQGIDSTVSKTTAPIVKTRIAVGMPNPASIRQQVDSVTPPPGAHARLTPKPPLNLLNQFEGTRARERLSEQNASSQNEDAYERFRTTEGGASESVLKNGAQSYFPQDQSMRSFAETQAQMVRTRALLTGEPIEMALEESTGKPTTVSPKDAESLIEREPDNLEEGGVQPEAEEETERARFEAESMEEAQAMERTQALRQQAEDAQAEEEAKKKKEENTATATDHILRMIRIIGSWGVQIWEIYVAWINEKLIKNKYLAKFFPKTNTLEKGIGCCCGCGCFFIVAAVIFFFVWFIISLTPWWIKTIWGVKT
ncbi:MAG TPA: hypothetical protein VFQ60_05535 [Patescibacteria group bacterium]|nr:hypothetical protein [Patescibacteria group bacterium]